MPTATRRCAYKQCGQRKPHLSMIIKGVNAWCNSVCQTNHALLNLNKLRDNKAREAKNEEKQKRKERRHKKAEFYANDVSKQKSLTQTAANALCNALDAGKNCVSCGRPLVAGRARHASHFKSRGSNSFLRYSMINLHSACSICNQWKSGEIEGYREGLRERYGPAILDYLDNAPRSKEWECAELIDLRKILNAEIRHIGKGNPPTRNWRSFTVDRL